MYYIKVRLFLLLIILSAIFWRFYNFPIRWTLSQDQARDGIIALYSIEHHTLPLIGPPSSAGSFSFGPLYYWFIILFTLIIPTTTGPWIGFCILSTFSVLILYFFGQNLIDKKFASLLGLIAAFASLDVFNAPDMLNPMLIGFSLSLAFFSLQKIVEESKKYYSIVLGISIGMAINFHLQSLSLLPLLPLALIFNKSRLKERVKTFSLLAVGLILSFIPLIIFDILHKGAWISSIFQYIISGQNKFNILSSWVYDLKDFWPTLWGETITNLGVTGYLFVLLLVFSIFIIFKRRVQTSNTIKIIFISFLVQIILLHFYKGPRMPVYLIVYHPFLIFFLSYSLWIITKFHRTIGIILVLLILSISTYSNLQIINQGSQVSQVMSIKKNLEKNINGNFRVYSYESSWNISLPLFYLLKKEGKISDNGVKIGACDHVINRTEDFTGYIENCPMNSDMIVEDKQYRIFKEGSSSAELFEVTDQKIYNWLYSNYPN